MTRFFTVLCAMMVLAAGFLATTEAQAQAYKVRPGDTLLIEVLEDPSLNRQTLVLPDGRITVPQAGSVQASGLTLGQIGAQLADALAPNFAAPPNVFVGLAQLRPRTPRGTAVKKAKPTMEIYVLGAVNKPGQIEVRKGATALQAFAAMGGFTKFAATKRIQIRRTAANGAQTTIRFNYAALEKGAALAKNPILQDGDTIVVPQRRLFE